MGVTIKKLFQGFNKMKLNFLIIFVCSFAEGFRFPRLSSFKPPSFKPPRFRPPAVKLPSVKLPSVKLPSFKGGQSGGLDTFLNGANLVATLGLIGVEAIGMTEADRLQDEAMKNQAKLQQAQFDHDKNMAANKQAAEDLGAPNICIECYEELEKYKTSLWLRPKIFVPNLLKFQVGMTLRSRHVLMKPGTFSLKRRLLRFFKVLEERITNA